VEIESSYQHPNFRARFLPIAAGRTQSGGALATAFLKTATIPVLRKHALAFQNVPKLVHTLLPTTLANIRVEIVALIIFGAKVPRLVANNVYCVQHRRKAASAGFVRTYWVHVHLSSFILILSSLW
jgi:hypothetical protein